MKTKIIALMAFPIAFTLVGCSDKSEKLSAQDLAMLSEMESDTQSRQESTSSLTQVSDQQSTSSASSRESMQTAQPDANKQKDRAAGAVVVIREKMFIAQTNDIYINKDDYLGKTIKYEGIFDQSTWRGNGKTYRYVIRFGPGCCPGDAAAAGFEVYWDKGYPKENDWVEAVGVLEEYDDNGMQTLRLALTSLKVLAKRGKERVTQ